MADRVTELLVDALKQALAEPGEQRLFKSGKLDGLFATRTGVNAEGAERAVRDGLLEVVRTEPKGKTPIEWVRITPKGVDFLHAHESPVQALQDLHAVLQATRDGIPLWIEEMRHQLRTLTTRLEEEAARWTHRLDALCGQVEESLRRAEAGAPQVSEAAAVDAPWALDALGYLDRRRASGAPGECPLPELFAALRDHYEELSVPAFHDRLRRLQDRNALRLLPFDGDPSAIPEPEYALVDGNSLFYYAAR